MVCVKEIGARPVGDFAAPVGPFAAKERIEVDHRRISAHFGIGEETEGHAIVERNRRSSGRGSASKPRHPFRATNSGTLEGAIGVPVRMTTFDAARRKRRQRGQQPLLMSSRFGGAHGRFVVDFDLPPIHGFPSSAHNDNFEAELVDNVEKSS